MQRLITLGLLLSLLAVVSLSSLVSPRSSAQILNTVNQYTAKFVCGKSKGEFAAPGEYFTIINVHNPATDPSKGTVKFLKKFALGERDEHVGKISPYCQTSLKADEVMGIDCPNIYKHLGISQGTFIEGFAVVQTNKELDIVSVFTAGHDQVEAFHTERVPFRKVPPPGCSDLNLSINTGSTPWRIVVDPLPATTEDRPASIVNVPAIFPIPWPSLTTSAWVGPFANSGVVPVAGGDYIYDFTFCLCPGFSNAKLKLQGLADNRGVVSLNGLPLATISTIPTSAISTTAGFITGTNTLRVVVRNFTTSATGLNINGSITATAGRCAEACEGQLGSQP